MDHAPVSMEFVSRDWHNSQEHQRDNWDRQVFKNMVMNPHAATALIGYKLGQRAVAYRMLGRRRWRSTTFTCYGHWSQE
eukprot:12187032-Heterocapsa_arctica.AAC.1